MGDQQINSSNDFIELLKKIDICKDTTDIFSSCIQSEQTFYECFENYMKKSKLFQKNNLKKENLVYHGIYNSLHKDQILNMHIFPFLWKNNIQFILRITKQNQEQELKRLKELDEYKNRLLATVSHDLRTPLNAIIYSINTTLSLNQNKKINKCLNIAKGNCMFLMNLINDILDYCLSKSQKIRLNIQKMSIPTFLKDIEDIGKYSAKLKNIKLEVINEILSTDHLITDPKRLQQVVINLLTNAIKFTSKGYVKIIAKESTNYDEVFFVVEDTGSGMKPEVVQNLGKAFATFSTDTNKNVQGIGLGLHLSSKLISLIGPQDHFDIATKLNKGSSFSFAIYKRLQEQNNYGETVCLNSQNSNNSENYSESDDLEIQKVLANFSEKQQIVVHVDTNILIVDDNVFNIFVMKKQLKKFNSHLKINQCNNGQEALEYFQNSNKTINNSTLSLIIMDCEMPIMNGFIATKEIKKLIFRQNYVDVNIIGSTALLTDEEVRKGIKSGMKLMIPKPIDQKQFEIILKKELKLIQSTKIF